MEAVKYLLYRTLARVTTQLQKGTVRTTHAIQNPSLLIFEKSIAGLLFYPFNNSGWTHGDNGILSLLTQRLQDSQGKGDGEAIKIGREEGQEG